MNVRTGAMGVVVFVGLDAKVLVMAYPLDLTGACIWTLSAESGSSAKAGKLLSKDMSALPSLHLRRRQL